MVQLQPSFRMQIGKSFAATITDVRHARCSKANQITPHLYLAEADCELLQKFDQYNCHSATLSPVVRLVAKQQCTAWQIAKHIS